MINRLFKIYSALPYKYKYVVAKLSFILRVITLFLPTTIRLGSYQMFLDRNDNAMFRYRRHRENYERVSLDGYLTFLSQNPGSIAIDIGASYGAYSLKAANIGQYGLIKKIYSFEPDETAYKSLKRSIEANKFHSVIDARPYIVGDYNGEADLLLSLRASTSNQTFATSGITTVTKRRLSVPCVTLDSFLSDQIEYANEKFVIKMDVEGSELRVLKGMKRILEASTGYAIFCEYYPQGIKDCGNSVEEFRGFFDDLDIERYFITDGSMLQEIPRIEFVRKMMDVEEQSGSLISMTGFEFVVSSRLKYEIN